MNPIEIYSNESAVPTCISCSLGGNLVTIGFTDDRLRLYDMRTKGDDFYSELECGHTNIPRQVKLSSDGMVCYSVGSDNTMRVWDISTRKCIKIYKSEKNISKSKMMVGGYNDE